MKKYIFCLFLVFLFISCVDNILSPEQLIPKIEVDEKNDLFIYDETSNNYQIKVNNKNYLKHNGYSIWNILGKNQKDTFQNLSVTVAKYSGVADMGYGIVFACKEDLDSTSMLAILITTGGYYCIGQVINGEFRMNKKWSYSQYLVTGYEKENKITVTHNLENNRFEIYFNNHMECEIQNTVSTFKDLGWGFVTTISPYENFDTSYVCVMYKVD